MSWKMAVPSETEQNTRGILRLTGVHRRYKELLCDSLTVTARASEAFSTDTMS